jgi:hypothetical protein
MKKLKVRKKVKPWQKKKKYFPDEEKTIDDKVLSFGDFY